MSGAGGWCAVVPLRAFATAKRRLRGRADDRTVDVLARRLALHTLGVLESAPRIASVLVVTDEPERSFAGLAKVAVLREERAAGLDLAVLRGLRHLGRAAADADPRARTLVLHGDLPLLSAADVAEALATAEALGHDAFVPDDRGTGTTALAYAGAATRPPAFGDGSARRHREAGFAMLELPVGRGMRADLDTWQQFERYRRSHPQEMARLLPQVPVAAGSMPMRDVEMHRPAA